MPAWIELISKPIKLNITVKNSPQLPIFDTLGMKSLKLAGSDTLWPDRNQNNAKPIITTIGNNVPTTAPIMLIVLDVLMPNRLTIVANQNMHRLITTIYHGLLTKSFGLSDMEGATT